MKSVNTTPPFDPAEYPVFNLNSVFLMLQLLAELAEFLVQLQSMSTYENNVEALASGTVIIQAIVSIQILCNIFADSINSDIIESCHHNASYSKSCT